MTSAFDPDALYVRLDRARRTARLSWRRLADQAGVSPSCTSRLTHGDTPSVDNLSRLLLWLGDTDLKPYITKETSR